ncbi:MAG: glycosyltransferase family 2 protein [Bacteroidetes bacterium]|nr:MAG: glycosyltransferase family 2 protein [Bacteroidota bacterium]
MKVAGFTFIRNAIKYDYPIVEAIKSILPICDEFVVAVGNSDDSTLDLIKNIDKEKIRIIETVWDDTLREGGKVLAVETDKAFNAVSSDADWAFYIQGDEVVHEKYLDTIYSEMQKYKDDIKVDGLLFKYMHFYGSYDYVGNSYRWYRREIRVVKNNKKIYSYRDAQGFRKNINQKLNVKLIDAYVYHYGWVKDPRAMQGKQETFNKLWHDDDWMKKNVAKSDEFDYSNINSLKHFEGTHPAVMASRIKQSNWKFDYDISYNKVSAKEFCKRIVEKITGIRVGEYKNYKIV